MSLEKLPDFLAGVPDGGLTGQVLIKNSNTSYDYSWGLAVGGSGQNAYVSVTAVDSGDGNQYIFNTAPVNAAACMVFVTAAFQPPAAGVYTITPPYTITFQPGSGVPAGLVVHFMERTLATNTLTPGYYSYTVTNPAGESTITVPTLDANYCDVFIDGAYNPPSEYTIVSPTQISFTPALPVNTVVDFRRLIPVGVPAPAQIHVSARQTVLSAKVDSNGYPNYITAGTGLAVDIDANPTPVVMTTANGSDQNGDRNYVCVLDTDISITGLTPSTTCYLYAELAPGGIIVGYGHSTLAPIYTWGAASTVSGQYTFRIPEMKGYVGNGVSAVATHRVYLGEAVTGVATVTSVVNYALQGKFRSTDQALPANATVKSFSHNIGVREIKARLWLKNVTAQYGYVTGDIVEPVHYPTGSVNGPVAVQLSSRNAAQFISGNGGSCGLLIQAISGGGIAANQDPTPANWNIFMVADRGW